MNLTEKQKFRPLRPLKLLKTWSV